MVNLAGSGLCLGSHDLSFQEPKVSEHFDFEDVDMKEEEVKWPMEVLVGVAATGQLTVLERESYKFILSKTLSVVEEVAEGGHMAVITPGEDKVVCGLY